MPEDNRRSAVGGCFGGAVVRVDSHHTVGFSGGCLGAKLTFFLDNPKRCGFVFFYSVDNNGKIFFSVRCSAIVANATQSVGKRHGSWVRDRANYHSYIFGNE